MMGRAYVLSGENLTLGTGNVLAAIQSAAAGAAGSRLEIDRIEIGQSGTGTSAQIRAAFGTRDTAGTLTTTSMAPNPLTLGGPASGISGNVAPAGGTARSGVNSSADSGGTYLNTVPRAFNNIVGDLWVPTPENRIVVPPSVLFVVRLLATPTGTTGWTVAVHFREVY